jgi:uncharacterized protein YPO0396
MTNQKQRRRKSITNFEAAKEKQIETGTNYSEQSYFRSAGNEELETNRRELDKEIDAVNYQMKRGLVEDELKILTKKRF